MRNLWGCFGVVLLLAACGDDRSQKPPRAKSPIVREEEMKPEEARKPGDPRQPDVAIDDIQDPPRDDRIVAPGTLTGGGGVGGGRIAPDPDATPECVDQGPVVSFDPAKLRACFDTNDDGSADRCVTWRRDGKVKTIDTMFDVEDESDQPEADAKADWRSDSEHNDDERITLDGSTVVICPYDRACMTLMPRVGEGEIQHALTDPDYRRAVFVIRGEDGSKGTLEMWDLASGRLRTRVAMKRLVADELYDFSAHMGTGVVISLADDSNSRALGTIFGIDGGVRGELAGGSRNLDIEKTFRHAGVFGIVDVGPIDEEKPYVLYLTSLANGGALGKFTIKRDEMAGDLEFHTLKNNFVAVTQWGDQLRIDMIDLRSRTNRILFAPGC